MAPHGPQAARCSPNNQSKSTVCKSVSSFLSLISYKSVNPLYLGQSTQTPRTPFTFLPSTPPSHPSPSPPPPTPSPCTLIWVHFTPLLLLTSTKRPDGEGELSGTGIQKPLHSFQLHLTLPFFKYMFIVSSGSVRLG